MTHRKRENWLIRYLRTLTKSLALFLWTCLGLNKVPQFPDKMWAPFQLVSFLLHSLAVSLFMLLLLLLLLACLLAFVFVVKEKLFQHLATTNKRTWRQTTQRHITQASFFCWMLKSITFFFSLSLSLTRCYYCLESTGSFCCRRQTGHLFREPKVVID